MVVEAAEGAEAVEEEGMTTMVAAEEATTIDRTAISEAVVVVAVDTMMILAALAEDMVTDTTTAVLMVHLPLPLLLRTAVGRLHHHQLMVEDLLDIACLPPLHRPLRLLLYVDDLFNWVLQTLIIITAS